MNPPNKLQEALEKAKVARREQAIAEVSYLRANERLKDSEMQLIVGGQISGANQTIRDMNMRSMTGTEIHEVMDSRMKLILAAAEYECAKMELDSLLTFGRIEIVADSDVDGVSSFYKPHNQEQ